jgi:sorting nexin-9/18/33
MSIPIPPLPDKQISGRYQQDFIRHRLNQLQLWVNRICRHPVLSQSDVWMHFMICTDEKRWKTGKRRAEKDDFTGASFFFTVQPPNQPLEVKAVEKQTEQFNKFVAKMDESVKHLFNTAQDQSKKYTGPYRREFGKVSNSFAQLADAFATSGYSQEDGALNEALRHTSATYDTIGKLYEEQPRHDLEPLSDALYEYKGLLSNWPDIMQIHKGALNRKKEHLKLEENGLASSSVSTRADVVSYAVMAEIDYFQKERVADFKVMMQNFLHGQIDFYEKIVSELKGNLTKYD